MQNIILTPNLQFWLQWLEAFLIVVAVLMIGSAIHEYIQWRRDR